MVASLSEIPATQFDGTPELDMRFPAMPRTVTEVPRLVDEAGGGLDIGRLTEVVEADPVVAPAVMRRVNSAYHGLRRRVYDVRQAVALLGFLEVSNIALTAGLLRLEQAVAGEEQAEIFRRIMRLSIGAGFYARRLAVHLGLAADSRLSTAGLFHGLGRLVLLHNRPDDYEALWLSHDEGEPPQPQEERAIFGVDHAELSAYAAHQWLFPELLERTLGAYLDPEQLAPGEARRAAHLVAAAVYAAHRCCLTDDAEAPPIDPAETPLTHLAEATGFDADALAALVDARRDEARAYVHMMMTG